MTDCIKLLISIILSTLLTISTNAQPSNQQDENPVTFIQVTENDNINLTPDTLSHINPNILTVFLIHGWYTSAIVDTSLMNITKTLSLLKDRNVIYVDWSTTAQDRYRNVVNYGIAKIGNKVGEMIMLLHEELDIDVKSIQIIGVTLGAHIAGYAGRYVRANHPEDSSLGRITGLEASAHMFGPILGIFQNPRSLRSTDADIVDVTHTNSLYFGNSYNLGTVDFYVNGGRSQPFCGDVGVIDYVSASALNVCSHAFATVLYQLAINNEDYRASADPEICENVVVYGDKLSANVAGVYYLDTEDTWPFKSTC